MGTLNEDLSAIKTVEDTLTSNKVARFAYTDLAYANNDANGVAEYDVNQEQNIPVATASVMKVNDTVLSKGYRSQASSVTRMLLNHFLGRLSYNVNKVNDNMSSLLSTLISHRGTANGLATLDADGLVPNSQLPTKVISTDSLTITEAPEIVTGDTVKVLFTADITGTDDTTAMAISYNGDSYDVKVPKAGVLSNFTATELTTGNFTYIDAYKYLELLFDETQFIIIGNPIVLSGEDYEVYADGKVGNEPVGTVRALTTVNVPYGWALGDHSAISRTKHYKLFNKYNTEEVEISGVATKLINIYGTGDGSTTFNIPDLRESVLVGTGQNDSDTIASHDVYTVGQFKDDQLKSHRHAIPVYARLGSAGTSTPPSLQAGGDNYGIAWQDMQTSSSEGGTTTRTKQKGVTYIVKVL